jgi:hypothetical protein
MALNAAVSARLFGLICQIGEQAVYVFGANRCE